MAKTTKAAKAVDQLTYEQALQELEDILTALESEPVGLKETMKMFERGKNLIRHCQTLLDQAELKVHTLEQDKNTDDLEE